MRGLRALVMLVAAVSAGTACGDIYQWGLTITFELVIPVLLNGTLELLIDPNEETDLPSLVGTTY